MKAQKYIANFDSAAAMLKATASFLHGKDFPGLGMTPKAMLPAAELLNKAPNPLKEKTYMWSGAAEAVSPNKLADIRSEDVAAWMVGLYPRKQYPAIAIGSSNGALSHLWSALQIPWLPQTYLTAVRRSEDSPDEPKPDMEWGALHAAAFLAANPDLQLHHMHDPNQDRLMVQKLTYFRAKKLRLGDVYKQYISDCLEPGGTIFVVNCRLKWKTTKVSERHYFQFGALGGATPDEFLHGSERVAAYLERYGSPYRKWDAPQPTEDSPEAEWGFEPTLLKDIQGLAKEKGYKVVEVGFDEPEDASPMVADIYRQWYDERGISDSRLFIESFIVMEPYWTLKTGSIPYWMVFNMEPSYEKAVQYLQKRSFEEIYMTLFSHGVESVGLVPIEQWKKLLARAGTIGDFIGVDTKAYPRDFAVFIKYHTDLQQKIAARHPMPEPLALDSLNRFIAKHKSSYAIQWDRHAQ